MYDAFSVYVELTFFHFVVENNTQFTQFSLTSGHSGGIFFDFIWISHRSYSNVLLMFIFCLTAAFYTVTGDIIESFVLHLCYDIQITKYSYVSG